MRGLELIKMKETITLGIRDSRIYSQHRRKDNAGVGDAEFQNDMTKKGAMSIKSVWSVKGLDDFDR